MRHIRCLVDITLVAASLFGETDKEGKAGVVPVVKPAVFNDDESSDEDEGDQSDIPVTVDFGDKKETESAKEEKKPEVKQEEAKADKKADEDEAVPEKAEIIEINIPEDKMPVSFGDEEKAAPAPVIPKEAYEKAPSKKSFDPDIADDEDLPSDIGHRSGARADKRELKRKAREEKLAQKEAKRQEKLDKKVKKTGFQPGSDIDIFPEDDE